MIKLNIGCGYKILEGWINIDGNDNPGVDLTIDLSCTKLPYPDNTVDFILAENILEHMSRYKQEEFLSELVRVLKVGGRITLEMPHLTAIVERYMGMRGRDLKIDIFEAASRLFGAQEDDFGCHRWIYDKESLLELLAKVGLHSYIIGEYRDFNLVCDSIKSNSDTLDGAFLSCVQTTIDSKTNYYVVDVDSSANDLTKTKKAVLGLVVRLSEIGVVFLLNNDRYFENDTIINVPDNVRVVSGIIKRSSGLVCKSNSKLNIGIRNIPIVHSNLLPSIDDCLSQLRCK